jgi:DNA-binding response OmpR family regulator
MTALLADPDQKMARVLARRFAAKNVKLTICADGGEALLQAGLTKPDVVVVSSALPVVDGVTVTRVLRRRRSTPVIIGVTQDDATSIAEALGAGAVSFVRRPYRFEELLRMLRASDPGGGDGDDDEPRVLECGPLEMDDSAHEVYVSGRPVALPLREYSLLRYLMQNANRAVSHAEIREYVWGCPGDTNTVSVHVRRLRVRLGDTSEKHALIHTIRGVGYQLQALES